MGKNNKKKNYEYRILILAILLIVVLFLVFSFGSKNKGGEEIKKSPQGEQDLSSAKQTIEGTLEVIHSDDFKNKKAYYEYYLRTDDGKKYSLEKKEELVNLKSGSRLSVKGYINFDAKNIENLENIQYLQPPEQGAVIGEQRTLAVAVNFQDSPNNPPWWTLDDLREIMFEHPTLSVNAYYAEASYGLVSFVGDVAGWYSLPLDQHSCTEDMMISETVNALSRDPNIDLSQYEHLIIVFYEGCDWQRSGGARGEMSFLVNGRIIRLSVAFSTGPDRYIMTHEIGHNLRVPQLRHANSWDCGPDVLFGNCQDVEYGDPYDVMGYSVYNMNIINKEKLQWVSQSQIEEVTSGGIYHIEPIETVSTGIKGLKIRGGSANDSYNTIPLWYFLEYRQPIGLDNTPEIRYYNVTDGILLHSTVYRIVCSPPYHPCEFVYVSDSLLDLTPNSIDNYWADFLDSALLVGKTYHDPNAKITITPLQRTDERIEVEISFGLIRDYSFEVDSGIDFYPNWNDDDNIASNNKPDGYVTTSSGILDSNIKYQGSKSLKISVTNNRGYSYQDIPVEYNKRYRVSGYVKTDCIDNNCYGTILSECKNINHQPIWDYSNCKLNINPINIRRLYNNNNWTYIEFDVENNRQDARFLRVLCYNTPGPLPIGSGIVWCDSLNVIEIPRGGGVGSPLFLKAEPEVFGDR